MTEGEIEAFFRVVTDVRDRALFQVIYRRGLRATEACLLLVEDYHLSQRRLYVHALKNSTSDRRIT
jgi:site-specific recombinase XerD